MIDVKICGLTTESSVLQSVECGARYVGFVFYKKSPRYVDINRVQQLSELVTANVKKVGLFVNPTIRELEKYTVKVSLDYIQLHGNEAPDYIKQIKASFGIPIIKAIGVYQESDLEDIEKYDNICDQFLIDTKPSPSMILPGGNGVPFDWEILSNKHFNRPWFLAGGLNSSNVCKAINVSGAKQVDVSSGVELSAGLKDNSKIAEFINQVTKRV